MKRVAAKGPTTRLIDLSHYQGLCDLSYIKSLGVLGAIAKCTEYNVDNTYASDRASAKANGILFGGYDFFHPSRDPMTQADFFLKMAQPAKGDFAPMIDVETLDGVPARKVFMILQKWLDTVEKALGVVPMFYIGPYFAEAMALPASFKRYPLVVAHYGTDKPLVPDPWTDWTIHQYTNKGHLPGIPGNGVDLDRFNGTPEQLLALCIP